MLYGTTEAGGADGGGELYQIGASGALETVVSFCGDCPSGGQPQGGIVQAANGNLYGTTYDGGNANYGTVFITTPGGKLITLYSFCAQAGCADGSYPVAGLIQATDGNFYGTTTSGGANNRGTVFKLTSRGTLTTLYSFCSPSGCTDGADPVGALFQATDGNLYGTTYYGGSLGLYNGSGTVFRISLGLAPFVQTVPASAKNGSTVRILGTDLTSATSVTFNGAPATFAVVSATEITATVPTGATTGTIQVVTPSGTLSSNVPFRIP